MSELPVRGVYLYFEALRQANALEPFLAECEKKGLMLGVSDSLFRLGERHFRALRPPGDLGTMAAGPPCPACPNPPLK